MLVQPGPAMASHFAGGETMKNEWGFTNDSAELSLVQQCRDDAIADGWSSMPTYQNESIDRACKLSRDGWTAQVLTRENKQGAKWKFEAAVNVWGPDGLACNVPMKYSFEELSKNLSVCSHCKKEGVETHRVGFAGRVCSSCLPEQRKKIEYPGWCD